MRQPNRPVRSRRGGESGLTLIELLGVAGILAVLAAIVAFNFAGAHDRGGDAACRTDVGTVQAAVDAYRNDHADASSGASGPVPTYTELRPYIHATPHSCANNAAPRIGNDGTVTGILPSDGHSVVP